MVGSQTFHGQTAGKSRRTRQNGGPETIPDRRRTDALCRSTAYYRDEDSVAEMGLLTRDNTNCRGPWRVIVGLRRTAREPTGISASTKGVTPTGSLLMNTRAPTGMESIAKDP